MRQLILLRHAHAESATAGQDDIARPLSATGLAEARAAGLKGPSIVIVGTVVALRDKLEWFAPAPAEPASRTAEP